VQAERCAPLAGGTEIGFTIAEGIAVKHPGALTAPLLAELLDDVVTVSEEEISETLVLLAERAKLVVEGAGAAALAAVLAGRVGGGDGPALAILSGGNIDATLLISVMRHGLTHAGRALVLRSRVPDRPGELMKLLELVASERVNIVSVEHHREGMDIPIGETEVELTLLTRDQAHCDELLSLVEEWGYPAERVR
jgi:threonine dehydratase